ncbi:hypothetical protein AB0C02_28265 [Micromonospora sp. NPDC048999]|uniref:hypothetical protein n=1 Tax=Micromonospora sp. NPDC048999 TaxID=3155391 RepID=UPI0033E60C52
MLRPIHDLLHHLKRRRHRPAQPDAGRELQAREHAAARQRLLANRAPEYRWPAR